MLTLLFSAFVSVDRNGTETPMSAERWAEKILSIAPPEAAPRDVKDLYEVARGALCYGCFFYPLYALGIEQSYRVLEAALKHKCNSLDAPASVTKSFAKMVEWLAVQGLLTTAQRDRWDAARRLRNMTSHAEQQSIRMPTDAVNSLYMAVEMIEMLFGGSDPSHINRNA